MEMEMERERERVRELVMQQVGQRRIARRPAGNGLGFACLRVRQGPPPSSGVEVSLQCLDVSLCLYEHMYLNV